MTEVKDFAEIGEKVFRVYHMYLSDKKDEIVSMNGAWLLGFAMGFSEKEIRADKAEHEKAREGITNVILGLNKAFDKKEG